MGLATAGAPPVPWWRPECSISARNARRWRDVPGGEAIAGKAIADPLEGELRLLEDSTAGAVVRQGAGANELYVVARRDIENGDDGSGRETPTRLAVGDAIADLDGALRIGWPVEADSPNHELAIEVDDLIDAECADRDPLLHLAQQLDRDLVVALGRVAARPTIVWERGTGTNRAGALLGEGTQLDRDAATPTRAPETPCSGHTGWSHARTEERALRRQPRGIVVAVTELEPTMQPGDQVEDFTLPDEEGRSVRISDLWAEGPVVVFFYPAAMTAGCTAECRHFRDLASEFAALGAKRVGISADEVSKQRQFSEMHTFDFSLLSDPDGTIARRFGVRRGFGPLKTKRWTFVIDQGGRLLEVIKSETRMNLHADRALAVLAAR